MVKEIVKKGIDTAKESNKIFAELKAGKIDEKEFDKKIQALDK